jgi:hypothetical protein
MPNKYRIRGTMRNLKKNFEKYALPLKNVWGEDNFNAIEFVDMEMSDEQSIYKALVGVTCGIHVAAPMPDDNLDLVA